MSQRNRILKAVIYLGLSFFLLGPAAPSPDFVLARLAKPHGPVIPARFQGVISGLRRRDIPCAIPSSGSSIAFAGALILYLGR
jgi:hypothetical protein